MLNFWSFVSGFKTFLFKGFSDNKLIDKKSSRKNKTLWILIVFWTSTYQVEGTQYRNVSLSFLLTFFSGNLFQNTSIGIHAEFSKQIWTFFSFPWFVINWWEPCGFLEEKCLSIVQMVVLVARALKTRPKFARPWNS